MAKCSLCWDRLSDSKPPACVEACPTKARKLLDANVVAEDKLRKTALAMASLEARDDRKEGRVN
jgi:Fe-S-cluster-containing dehydrogenase component